MIKLLSVTKSGLITGSFLSLSFIIEASFPVDAANLGTKIASSENVPICYMETTGGQRLNLSYLCGKVSSP
ncbi:MAG: FxLYD domain-containing protein, partial [Microcoleaceae cyanobacterium]